MAPSSWKIRESHCRRVFHQFQIVHRDLTRGRPMTFITLLCRRDALIKKVSSQRRHPLAQRRCRRVETLAFPVVLHSPTRCDGLNAIHEVGAYKSRYFLLVCHYGQSFAKLGPTTPSGRRFLTLLRLILTTLP